MPSAAALAVLQQHYKGQRGVKLLTREKTLPNADKAYMAYATNADLPGGNNNYDFLGAAFTSNASGNQVVSIVSDAGYSSGNQPSAPETIAAIKQKYGEPSSTTEGDIMLTMHYGYRDGKVLTIDRACSGLTRLNRISLRNADVLIKDQWHREMADGAESDMASNMPAESTRCDAVMYVNVGYGFSIGPDRSVVPNKKTVSQLHIVFFDAKRFRAAVERDAAAVKEFKDKALQNAPAGKGPAKL